ncbi:MAG: asparagine synthase (glutamine-hydrolyzing) [Chitinophagaceae bacterium]|nr:asparagine synthase (glutamine-hydrolyzing) [Chitinophagaceae bacterium]
MCGIAGILQFNSSVPPGMIRRMTEAMAHRGPDAMSFFEEEGLAFGHRRLSIIDLSTAANQPFADHSGRYVIVFNGEIYNYREVKQQLPDYPFHTTSDTEVLLAAYLKWGERCLERMRGMFAFAVWDRNAKELFIARDGMGVKPLYYYQDNDRLIFASEIRAILSTGAMTKRLNPGALLDYFSYQSVTSPDSLIEGVSQLEAGTWMRWKGKKTESKRYWDVARNAVDFDMADHAAVKKQINHLMLQSIRRRLVSDVPVGAFLSGGIDSSVVVGLMAEAGPDRPNTFNIAFEEKEFDESHYAEIIAKKFNTNHTRLLLKPADFLDELQNALDAMDTPSGDGVNTYVVSKAIRKNGMTVALSGVGGDELFAGYPIFNQYLGLKGKNFLWGLPPAIRKMAAGLLPGSSRGRQGRIKQLLQSSSSSIEDLYPVFRQLLSPSLIRELTTLAPGKTFTTAVQQELARRRDCIGLLPLLSQVSVAEYLGYTQHTLLKDTDQMSMAVSLEVREPFFDLDLVSFVLAIPDSLKRPVYPKSLLVESLKPLLPDEVVHRKKQGFLFPWNVWLKNELRPFCEERINHAARRPFIDGAKLTDYWKKFLAGDDSIRWGEIWLFVVLEYWLEKNGIE